MLLAVDVGNTNIVLGLFEGKSLKQQFRLESQRGRMIDELCALVLQLLAMKHIEPDVVDAAIIASVVPPLTEPLTEVVRRCFGRQALVVGPGTRTGMAILIENPREVGADRIADAVAGYERAKGGVVVVDFGPSTNFDVVTPKGEYLAAVLAPGLQLTPPAPSPPPAKLPPV